mgnify:CR=1 FL=1
MNERIIILDVCIKELKKFPSSLQVDLLTIAEQLNDGVKLSLPLSRPMPTMGKGVHELRLKDASGQYRIIYYLKTKSGEILFIHAFKKKTQATQKKNLDLAKKRLRSLE